MIGVPSCDEVNRASFLILGGRRGREGGEGAQNSSISFVALLHNPFTIICIIEDIQYHSFSKTL